MFKTTICAATVLLLATPQVYARDLLAPSNLLHRHVVPVVETVADVGYPEPFSTTSGEAANVCSISGLGHTSLCSVRSWSERRTNFLQLAYR